MTAQEIKAATTVLERDARAMAAAVISAAGQASGASDMAHSLAELAKVIVALAEKQASLVSADEVADRRRQLNDLYDDALEQLEVEAHRYPDLPALTARAEEITQYGLAQADLAWERFNVWIAQHAHDAWQNARSELAKVVRSLPRADV